MADIRTRATLQEPIEWRLWKNRQRRDAIVVSLSTHEGRNLIGVRLHTTGQDGRMVPTTKGVSLLVERLPDLHAALSRALARAQKLGLISVSPEACRAEPEGRFSDVSEPAE
jgi:hypothetical protein